jgi:hypothetical protein
MVGAVAPPCAATLKVKLLMNIRLAERAKLPDCVVLSVAAVMIQSVELHLGAVPVEVSSLIVP